MEETGKQEFTLHLDSVVLDTNDIQGLADFYAKLLGWEIPFADETYVVVASPGPGSHILIQKNEDHTAPLWPEPRDGQQQQMHIDFRVKDTAEFEAALAHALACGAKQPEAQYGHDDARGQYNWITLLDPAGHPFCIVVG